MSVARPHRRFSTVENRVTSIPRQHMSVRPETQGKHSACVVAPSLPHTLADCAPPRPQSHRRFSTVENRPRRPPAPTCVCKHLSDRIPEVAKLPAPSRHRSPTRSQTVLGSRHSPIAVSRQSKISRIDSPRHSILVTGYPRSENCPLAFMVLDVCRIINQTWFDLPINLVLTHMGVRVDLRLLLSSDSEELPPGRERPSLWIGRSIAPWLIRMAPGPQLDAQAAGALLVEPALGSTQGEPPT